MVSVLTSTGYGYERLGHWGPLTRCLETLLPIPAYQNVLGLAVCRLKESAMGLRLSSKYRLFAIVCAMGPVGLVACSAPPGESGNSVGGQSSNVQPATGGSATMGGSGAAGGGHTTGGAAAVGGAANGGASTAAAPTWSQLFTNYFGPNTAGDCVASGCHGSASPTFTGASSMCSAMKSYGIISNGTASFDLVLKWFNQGGVMPRNNNPTPANAVADITAWEKAGAVCP